MRRMTLICATVLVLLSPLPPVESSELSDARSMPPEASSCDVKCWEAFLACTSSEDVCYHQFKQCVVACCQGCGFGQLALAPGLCV